MGSVKKTLADIEAEIRAETPKAFQLYDGKTTTFTMPEWLAIDKGFA